MPKVHRILERKEVLPYLEARNLLEQYKKTKEYLLQGNALRVKSKGERYLVFPYQQAIPRAGSI